MGQRFQTYVSYGKQDEPNRPGENLFAMHLQWCWGPYSIIRADQLVNFLDGAKDQMFNPFGLGERSTVGGFAYDGRREDLYLLRALTEINTTSSSIVAGHDLMAEENDWDIWRFERGDFKAFPTTIQMDPLAQDNNDGFLVVQAKKEGIKFAFCKDNTAIEPVGATEYLNGYQDGFSSHDESFIDKVKEMATELDCKFELLTAEEITQIFDKDYDKELNVEGFQMPEMVQEHEESISELLDKAKERLEEKRVDAPSQSKPIKQHSDPSR